MNNAPAILWYEWFNDTKREEFQQTTEKIWSLLLRNGIASTVFKKWLREAICREEILGEEKSDDIKEVIEKWINERGISKELFEKDKTEILSQFKIKNSDFEIYCENELKAIKWANKQWESSTPQLYLEYKDKFDRVKLKILSVEIKAKGIILEAYQQLKEKEVDFSKISQRLPGIKYSTEMEGNWFKASDVKKEIRYRVERLTPGNICKPFKVDERYIIVELVDRKGTKLTEEIKRQLELMQLNKFLEYGVSQLLDIAYER